MNFRKDESSFLMMETYGKAVKRRYLHDILSNFCSNMDQEEMKATIMGATNNPE